jgi:iron complex outermembrane receptor protein
LTSHARAAEEETLKIDEIVVTATRYEEALTSVPANVTVITEEKIENSTAQNIPDLLRTEVGIHVNDIAGNRRTINVDIRGFGETAPANTLVLVDGRRVNQADLSGTDWTQIPLERIQKIEIIRGGRGSVLYGDNATGGVINIITKEGEAFKPEIKLSMGSYDTYIGTAHLSGKRAKLSYSLSGGSSSSDGYRDNSDGEAKDLGVNLRYSLADFLKLHFSSGYHHDKTGLPGALQESDFAAGLSRAESVHPDDFADVEDYYIKGGPKVYFLDDSMVKIDLSYRKRNSASFASSTFFESRLDDEIKTFEITPQLLLRSTIKNTSNTLTLGFDYQKAEKNVLSDFVFFGVPSTGEFRLEKKNYGYYIHDEISIFESLHLSGGYRHDKADFFFSPSFPDHTTIDEDLLTAGINYHFHGKSYVYFSFSKSFRYPLLDEIFAFNNTINTDLLPQKTNDYEIGMRHYLSDRFYTHVNLFRINTENEIFFNRSTFMNENLEGKTRRNGVEISFHALPYEWLTFNGSYTYMDTEIKEGTFEDNEVPNVPNNKATFETVLYPGGGFTVTLNGIYIGERVFISDFENIFGNQEDYLVINGKIQYHWKLLTAFLDINNINNEEYSEYGVIGGSPAERAFYPSPKTNFLAGVSVEF